MLEGKSNIRRQSATKRTNWANIFLCMLHFVVLFIQVKDPPPPTPSSNPYPLPPPSNLSFSERSSASSLFTNEEQKTALDLFHTLLHTPLLFYGVVVHFPSTKWQHSRLCFRNCETVQGEITKAFPQSERERRRRRKKKKF